VEKKQHSSSIWSRESLPGVVTRLEGGRPTEHDSICSRGERRLSSSKCQSSPRAHQPPTKMDTGGIFPGEGMKWRGREDDHLSPSRTNVKNEWSCISTPHASSWPEQNNSKVDCYKSIPIFSSFGTNILPSTCGSFPHLHPVLYCTLGQQTSILHHISMYFEVLMALTVRINAFWELAPCSPTDNMHYRFRGTCCLRHQHKNHKHGKSIFLWNVWYTSDYTAWYPVRQLCLFSIVFKYTSCLMCSMSVHYITQKH
jgi:hypothetical protein